MREPIKSIRVVLEVPCDECNGEGVIYFEEGNQAECPECRGIAYFREKLSLLRLKHLLDGGDL